MAKDDDLDLDVDTSAAEKPKSKMMLIIIIVVLLLGISGGATVFLTGMLDSDEAAAAAEGEAGAADSEAKAARTRAPLSYFPLDPPFVVNFSASSDVRFLQVTIELGTRNADVIPMLKEHKPAIRNALVMLFSSQDPVELDTREGKEKLLAKALEEVQKVLKEETGDPGVESAFFTSFVMQ